MKVLAIDTSSETASCAVCEDEDIICNINMRVGLTHSQTLMVCIDDMLKIAKIKLEDIDAIAVALGPGSFTGLRIGVAAAKGLAFGLKLSCVGISTLFGLSYNVRDASGLACCLLDARNDNFYVALFNVKEQNIKRLWKDSVLHIKQIEDKLKQQDETIFLVGEGAESFFKKTSLENTVLVSSSSRFCSATSIGFLAIEKLKTKSNFEEKEFSQETLKPEYIRLSQAEQKRFYENNKGE